MSTKPGEVQYRGFSRQAENRMKKLIPSLAYSTSNFDVIRYRVNLMGILMADKGKADLQLLVRFLRYVQKRYQRSQDFDMLSDIDLRKDWKLGGNEKLVFRTALLAFKGGFVEPGVNGIGRSSWLIHLAADFHRIQFEKNLLKVVEEKALLCLTQPFDNPTSSNRFQSGSEDAGKSGVPLTPTTGPKTRRESAKVKTADRHLAWKKAAKAYWDSHPNSSVREVSIHLARLPVGQGKKSETIRKFIS